MPAPSFTAHFSHLDWTCDLRRDAISFIFTAPSAATFQLGLYQHFNQLHRYFENCYTVI